MLSPRGICYNLKESPYTISTGDIVFYFSSEFYRQKFEEEADAHRLKISESLSNRFDLKLSFKNMADIVLYSKIEKRGFYLTYKGVEYNCKKNLILRGDKVKEID